MRRWGLAAAGIAMFAAHGSLHAQQLPLAPARAAGQTATPVFEGWYPNPDGSYTLSFGYFNRNTEEILEIPIGPNNRIEPGDENQGQPTRFEPERHWGVFGIRVPADFGDKRVTWTLTVRGETFSIPGSLKRGWQIDALEGEAGSNNTPPVVRFDPAGPQGAGPGGITTGPITAKVGTPVPVTVHFADDGRGRRGRSAFVTLTWYKHQGPGDVSFEDNTPAAEGQEGSATTTATFSAPGDYVLRVRANDASGVSGAGHAQCCWTNGFVKVHVTG